MSTARSRSVAVAWSERRWLPAWERAVPALLALLAAAGLGVSGYLTYTHWAEQAVACGGLGNCELVQNSEYATLGPVPVALLGAMMYAALGGLALLGFLRPPAEPDWRVTAFWAIAFAGVAYSAYLTYIELFVLEAICVWCVASAVIVTAAWLLSTGYAAALRVHRA